MVNWRSLFYKISITYFVFLFLLIIVVVGLAFNKFPNLFGFDANTLFWAVNNTMFTLLFLSPVPLIFLVLNKKHSNKVVSTSQFTVSSIPNSNHTSRAAKWFKTLSVISLGVSVIPFLLAFLILTFLGDDLAPLALFISLGMAFILPIAVPILIISVIGMVITDRKK